MISTLSLPKLTPPQETTIQSLGFRGGGSVPVGKMLMVLRFSNVLLKPRNFIKRVHDGGGAAPDPL